jgi:hypothetical protein
VIDPLQRVSALPVYRPIQVLTRPAALESFSGTVEAALSKRPNFQAPSAQQREEAYLERVKDSALQERYESPLCSAAHIDQQARDFAQARGIDLNEPDLQKLVDQFFANPKASQNPLKHQLASEQTQRFVALAREAKPDAPAEKIHQLAAHNLALLAMQDRAAAEITFGEHGVRHLVGHNIRVVEALADQMQAHGTPVTAQERLAMHQAMLLHDLGYAADNVAGAMRVEGIKGQDAGHPLLGARYLKERQQDPADVMHSFFGPQDFEVMHRCILYHDMDRQGKPGIELNLGKSLTAGQKAQNWETLTRVADNSHAFDDKLSDLLYRYPAALKTMRQVKTACEIGRPEMAEALKDKLRQDIDRLQDMSADDRTALKTAVQHMDAAEYDFSARRLVGSRPHYRLEADGQLHIEIRQSPLHSGISQMSGLSERRILPGYVADLTGQKPLLEPTTMSFAAGPVSFEFSHSDRLDDYQKLLASQVLADKSFRTWALTDSVKGLQQRALESVLKSAGDLNLEELRSQAAPYLESTDKSREALLAELAGLRDNLRAQRAQGLESATA